MTPRRIPATGWFLLAGALLCLLASPYARLRPDVTGGPMPDVCTPICGDGLRVGPELCDDGNARDGDGCSSLCVPEPTTVASSTGNRSGTSGGGFSRAPGSVTAPSSSRGSVRGTVRSSERSSAGSTGGTVVGSDAAATGRPGTSGGAGSASGIGVAIRSQPRPALIVGDDAGGAIGQSSSHLPDSGLPAWETPVTYPDAARPAAGIQAGAGEAQVIDLPQDANGFAQTGRGRPGTWEAQVIDLPGGADARGEVLTATLQGRDGIPGAGGVTPSPPHAVAPVVSGHAPVGDTGPGVVIVVAAGAAAGWAWVRRRRT
jgi:cysteine-rich repeat protein